MRGLRVWHLWSYIDDSCAAAVVILSLSSGVLGPQHVLGCLASWTALLCRQYLDNHFVHQSPQTATLFEIETGIAAGINVLLVCKWGKEEAGRWRYWYSGYSFSIVTRKMIVSCGVRREVHWIVRKECLLLITFERRKKDKRDEIANF